MKKKSDHYFGRHKKTPGLICISYVACLLFLISFIALPYSNVMAGNSLTELKAGQQQGSVKGKITDANGAPLPGVTVMEKGTSNGTATDLNGEYTLMVSSGDAVLVVSFIGMLEQEIQVGSRSVIDVTMSEDIEQLEEVVVVGYGSMKKADLTGSVASVNVKDMNKVRVTDPIIAMQGIVTGVNVTRNSGAPGDKKLVTIRGYHTLNNNEPLYIIDGVAGDLSYVNPDDIETISILKDGASASIYGTRAAGGVIIITTKKGSKGEPQISASSDYSFQKITKFWEMCNAEEYLKIHTAIKASEGALPDEWATNYQDYANTDWQKEMYRVAPMKKYNLSIATGSDNSSLYVSTAYSKEDGVIIESGLEKLSLNVNSDIAKGKWKFGESISLNRNIGSSLTTTGFGTNYDLLLALPHMSVYNEDNNGGFGGAVLNMPDVKNPVGSAKLRDDKWTTDYISSRIFSEVELIKGLKYKINLGYNLTNYRYFFFRPDFYMSDVDQEDLSYLREDARRTSEWVIENTATYNKVFDKHTFNLLLGYTAENLERRTMLAEGYNTPAHDITVLNGVRDQKNVDGFYHVRRLTSSLARLTYNYAEKYLFTGTFRRDASSAFGSDYRYGNFPSVAIGWKISNEDFFNKGVVNDLKLRSSIGMLGTEPSYYHNYKDYYLYQATITGGTLMPYVFSNSGLLYGSNFINISNPELKWESTTSRNIGVDMQLLKDRIGITADYYFNTSNDILAPKPIPFTNGTPSFWDPNALVINTGDIETKGFELSLSYRNSESALRYDITASISFNSDKVTSLGIDTVANPIDGGQVDYNGGTVTRTEKGHSVAEFYLFQSDGLFQSQAEIDAYVGPDGTTLIQPDAAPGDVKFIDTNNDGQIDEGDRVYSGKSTPKFEYSFNVNLKYKNFDLAVYLHGAQGNKIFNGLKYMTEGVSGYRNYSKSSLNFWTPENTNTDIPRATYDNPNYNSRESTRFLENGSFLRIKNIQLGYTLPKNIVSKINLADVRVYVGAYNLVTFTKYTGYDPEVGNKDFSGNPDIFSRGVDTGIYPVAKSLNYGVKINF